MTAAGLVLFALPGIPLARHIFDGPERVFAGGAIGYLATALAASGLYRMGLGEPVFIVAASLGLAGVAVMASRRLDPAPPVEPLEWRSLGAVWLVVVLITSLPFAHVGAAVDGGIAYRAYFSADLMTHLSVVAELQKGGFPLENPFYAGEPLGYYWLFFTLPATLGAITSNQTALLTTYLMGGLLFASLLFFTLRRTGLSGVIAAAGCAILLGAVSYEGVVAAVRDEPWTSINVDALSRWVYELISLDGLHRSLLYTPQHLFSYTLLLVLVLLVLRGEPRSTPMALLCGVLLGGMAGSSIVTAMLAGPWFILVLWRRRAARFWTFAVVTSTSALSFLAWYVVLGFFGDAGGAIALRTPRLLELPSLLTLDAGALVLLAALSWRKLDRDLLLLATMALAAVLFLDIRGYEGVWMAWRAGSVFLIALGLVAAQSFRRAFDWKTAIIVLPAVLTLALDVFNAQDVTNRELSPGGFPWTTVVSTGEWNALQWIRRETPSDAVVQWDVRARSPGEWALVPAIAQRRLAVGFPIFLLDVQKYRVRERRHVRPIFNSGDALDAHARALTMEIDYIVVGRQELNTRGDLVRPLFESEERFRTVYENDGVSVLEVIGP